MKLIATTCVLAALLAMAPSEASAWTCRATSPTGSWGWGSSGSLSAAQRRALWECAVRTPRGYTCRISRCR